MSDVKPPAQQEQPFERYPVLARQVEYFANKMHGISLGSWQEFTNAMNDTLSGLEAERDAAVKNLKRLTDAHIYTTPAGTTNCRYCDNNMDHEGTYQNMHADDCPIKAALRPTTPAKEGN
jgi:hypothetical protein